MRMRGKAPSTPMKKVFVPPFTSPGKEAEEEDE